MADLSTLDTQFRLQPWIDPIHNNFVTGQYGSRLCDRARAEEYVAAYEKKEKLADEAYELQRTLLRQSSSKPGETPQELPDQVKLDWNPRKKFPQFEEKVEEKPKAVEVPEEPKKRGRKKKF